jgi:hypothetical protein
VSGHTGHDDRARKCKRAHLPWRRDGFGFGVGFGGAFRGGGDGGVGSRSIGSHVSPARTRLASGATSIVSGVKSLCRIGLSSSRRATNLLKVASNRLRISRRAITLRRLRIRLRFLHARIGLCASRRATALRSFRIRLRISHAPVHPGQPGQPFISRRGAPPSRYQRKPRFLVPGRSLGARYAFLLASKVSSITRDAYTASIAPFFHPPDPPDFSPAS